MIDSHCHLDVAAFAADRHLVLERARQAGIIGQLIPAIDFASWQAIRSLCLANADLIAAYGLHPVFIARHTPAHLAALDDWLRTEPASAIGECGLDFFVDGLDRDAQRMIFQGHLDLARRHDRPLVIHARKALDEVIQRIRQTGPLRGVVHSFSGSEQQAEQLWSLGFSVGIGGPVTYERAKRLRQLVASMPIEHLLLETDSPDQPGAGHRGERNEPANLVEVLQCVARLRGESVQTVSDATSANATRLFDFLPPPQTVDPTLR